MRRKQTCVISYTIIKMEFASIDVRIFTNTKIMNPSGPV